MNSYVDDATHAIGSEITDDSGVLWTGGKEARVLFDLIENHTDVSPDYLTVDTGNHYDSVEEFREEFHANHDFTWHVRRHERLVSALQDPDDPRDYHGEWNDEASKSVDVSKDEWSVERSCGTVKVMPMKEFIQQDGYDTLVTGTRETDGVAGEDFSPVMQKREPARHKRVNPLATWSEEHVWAYIKRECLELPDLYDEGYMHTDSKCCTDDNQVGEHGEEGFDPELEEAKDKLAEMGYV